MKIIEELIIEELLVQNQKLIKDLYRCKPESGTISHLQKMADCITLLESELDSAIYLLISLAKATLEHNDDTLAILKAIISDIENE
jgi:hypothetical protein